MSDDTLPPLPFDLLEMWMQETGSTTTSALEDAVQAYAREAVRAALKEEGEEDVRRLRELLAAANKENAGLLVLIDQLKSSIHTLNEQIDALTPSYGDAQWNAGLKAFEGKLKELGFHVDYFIRQGLKR